MRKNFMFGIRYEAPVVFRMLYFFVIAVFISYIYKVLVQKTFIIEYSNYSLSYYNYALSGYIFHMFLTPVIKHFCFHLSQERVMGTLESILLSPTKLFLVLCITYCERILLFAVVNIPFVLLGLYFFHANIAWSNLPMVFCVLFLSFIMFFGFALLLGSYIVMYGRSTIAENILFYCNRLLGDIYFPVVYFPPVLKIASFLFPVSHAFRAFRRALFAGASFMDLAGDLFLISMYACGLIMIGLWTFSRSMRWALTNGTLAEA